MSSVILDWSIYSPGTQELKNPVAHWYDFTGTDKWLIELIMFVLVFRTVSMDSKV